MTPPTITENVSPPAVRALPALRRTTRRVGAFFRPGDIVFLVDAWLMVAILWGSRVVIGRLHPGVAIFGIAVFALVVLPENGDRLRPSALEDVGTITRRVVTAFALVAAITIPADMFYERLILGVAAITVPVLVAGRAATHAVQRSMRRRGAKRRTLIVGGGDIARQLVRNLAAHDEYGLRVVGAVDDDPKYRLNELGAPILGRLGDIPDIVAMREVEVVIVAFSAGHESAIPDVIRAAMAAGAKVWVVPRFFELGSGGSREHLWGLPVVRLDVPARSRPQWAAKRAFDFAGALLGAVVAAPLIGGIALAIALESGRPVLYRQRRVGRDGREFDMLKFRSMRAGGEDVESTQWRGDGERTTRVGRFLRTTSLDELPQLFNVLRGEMSIVGPRPERPHFVELFSDRYPQYYLRHRIPPGITGWSQIHGLRGDTSIEERAVFDNHYIENWSFSRDVKIILRTVGTLVRKEGR